MHLTTCNWSPSATQP